MTVDERRIGDDLRAARMPERAPTAVVDPHWLQLRGDSLLPTLYMPPTMRGSHPVWMRTVAAVLVSVFMLATALGVCLTYGPPGGW